MEECWCSPAEQINPFQPQCPGHSGVEAIPTGRAIIIPVACDKGATGNTSIIAQSVRAQIPVIRRPKAVIAPHVGSLYLAFIPFLPPWP